MHTKTLPVALTTALVFVSLTGILSWLDFLPEPVTAVAQEEIQATTTVELVTDIEPVEEIIPEDPVPTRIIIESLGIDSVILNPDSTDIAVLDEALLSGVVRYPESGLLNENSNLFLFGHSSYLPVIHNKNFKVFNELKNLKGGEQIRVQSETHEHLYKVESVRLTDATEAVVELGTGTKKLTISTCNSFGAKTERWVVEAEFLGSYPIVNK